MFCPGWVHPIFSSLTKGKKGTFLQFLNSRSFCIDWTLTTKPASLLKHEGGTPSTSSLSFFYIYTGNFLHRKDSLHFCLNGTNPTSNSHLWRLYGIWYSEPLFCLYYVKLLSSRVEMDSKGHRPLTVTSPDMRRVPRYHSTPFIEPRTRLLVPVSDGPVFVQYLVPLRVMTLHTPGNIHSTTDHRGRVTWPLLTQWTPSVVVGRDTVFYYFHLS